MMRITPSPPLGAYPQLLLCGQVGNDPTSSNTTTITMMVPMPMVSISTVARESHAICTVCVHRSGVSVRWRTLVFDFQRARCGYQKCLAAVCQQGRNASCSSHVACASRSKQGGASMHHQGSFVCSELLWCRGAVLRGFLGNMA